MSVCRGKNYRIKGRVVDSYVDANDIYPKFTVYQYAPFLQGYVNTPDELAALPVDERVYEPVERGLGTLTNAMYVKTKNRTLLFVYPDTEITWGSHVVFFGSPIDFSGTVVDCSEQGFIEDDELNWNESGLTFSSPVTFG